MFLSDLLKFNWSDYRKKQTEHTKVMNDLMNYGHDI